MVKKNSVDARSWALASGLTWAFAVFVLGLGSLVVPSWANAVNWIGQFYMGYTVSFMGSIIGAIWGFFDLFIGVYVLLWLYNYFHNR